MQYDTRGADSQSLGTREQADFPDLGDGAARGQSAELLGEGDLTTADGGITPITRLDLPPKDVDDGDIIHLIDGADLATERGKTGAHYLHVAAGGEESWFYLGDSPDSTVVDALVTPLLDRNGDLRVPLSAAFEIEGSSVTAVDLGPTEGAIEADTKAARDVLQQSNDKSNAKNEDDVLGQKMDAIWDVMNNDRDELEADELPDERRVGKNEKEGAWYNAIRLEGDTPEVKRSGNDERKGDLPELTKVEYQQMLVRDFDYQGAITAFKEAGGEDAFVAAVIRRQPEKEKELRVIAGEVWSYATTGADTSGKTDIKEMQGYLYALDPKIQVSSDSNTKKGKMFNAGTAEDPIMIQEGDGAHGRATILTTRHIVADVTFEGIEPQPVPFEKETTELEFDERDRFTYDTTPSMTNTGGRLDRVQRSVDEIRAQQAEGDEPLRSMDQDIVGSFEAYELHVKTPDRDPNLKRQKKVQGEEGMREVKDFSVTLEAAFVRLFPQQSLVDAEKFLGLFDTSGQFAVGDYFKVTPSPDGNRYDLDGAKLQVDLGDDGKNTGESSLKSIITILMYHPEFADDALDNLAEGEKKPRLNAIADEQEQGLEYLGLTQFLAGELGIEVRLFAVPTNVPVKTIDPNVNVAVVDLQSMEVVMNEDAEQYGKGGNGEQVGTMSFVAWMGGTKTEKVMPITRSSRGKILDKRAELEQAGVPLVLGQETPFYAPPKK